jgi:hypothetical protein
MFTNSKLSRGGISRMECFVAFLILTCLICLIVPAVYQARESSRRAICMNTIKSLAFMLQNYHDVNREFPAGCQRVPLLQPEERWSWYLKVAPYWGHYGTPIIDYDSPWNEPSLRPCYCTLGKMVLTMLSNMISHCILLQ